MKLKELEMFLGDIDGFECPKIKLEQYETGHHIGARMLFTMNSFDDIVNKSVVDLGVGCGRLGLGCAYLGSSFVLGIDIDVDALEQCSVNYSNLNEADELCNFDLLCADINDDLFWRRFEKSFDVAVLNPPFGTKNNKGIDMIFLKRAIDLTKDAVYSLHKSSTRDYILKKAHNWGVECEVLAQLRYDLPKTYKFHTKESKDIQVDFYRFKHIH